MLLFCSTDTLISPSGNILIPGIREAVAPLSDEEWRMYQDIQFDMDNYKNKVGVDQLMYSNKVRQSLGKGTSFMIVATSLAPTGFPTSARRQPLTDFIVCYQYKTNNKHKFH